MAADILIVENREGISELITISLGADYDTATVENGSEAIDTLKEKNIQVLICDATMPDMDGIELLCKVKKERPGTEVIIITDADNPEAGFKALKYEASDFIIKPVTSESLDIVLERAFRKIAIRKRLNPSSEFNDETDTINWLSQLLKTVSDYDSESPFTGLAALIDKNMIIRYSTPALNQLAGDITGKSVLDVFHSDTAPHPAGHVFECGVATQGEVKLTTIEDNELKLSVKSSALKTQDNISLFVVETYTCL